MKYLIIILFVVGFAHAQFVDAYTKVLLESDKGITKADSSGGSNPGVNQLVSTWADQSGKGNNWAQSTEAQRPIYDNGTIHFDGVNDQLTRTAINLTSPAYTVTIRFKYDDAADSYSTLFGADGASDAYQLTVQPSSSPTGTVFTHNGSGAATWSNQRPLSQNTWYVFTLVRNGTGLSFYVNGAPSQTATLAAIKDTLVTYIACKRSLWNFDGYISDIRMDAGVARSAGWVKSYYEYIRSRTDGLTDYYFDSVAGSDRNAGTSIAPLKTIAKIDSIYKTDITALYFKSGKTWSENLTITKDMTLSTYGGSGAVTIDQVDFANYTCTVSYCIYANIGTVLNADNVTIDYGTCGLPATTTRKRNFGGWGKYGGWLK